jgi:hypothetical protein
MFLQHSISIVLNKIPFLDYTLKNVLLYKLNQPYVSFVSTV